MEPEDIEVQKALIDAGYGSRAIATHADLHSTLIDLYHEDPDRNEDFVERLHAILKIADKRAELIELERELRLQGGIKGCPDCNLEPAVTPNGGLCCANLASHGEVGSIGTYCGGLKDNIVSWNDDEGWIRLGADPARTKARTVYPFSEQLRKELQL
jgi:hypothetical protein